MPHGLNTIYSCVQSIYCFQLSQAQSYNMALRELPDFEDATILRGLSAGAGRPTFWDTAEIDPKTEWEDWCLWLLPMQNIQSR